MRELIDAFSLMTFRQFAAVLYGLIRSKLLAAFLGPFGLGIVSQGTALLRLLQQFTELGVGNGFVKLASEYRTNDDQVRMNRMISTVLLTFGGMGLVVVLLSHFAAEQAAEWVFGDASYRNFVVIIALASVFVVEFNFILRIFQSMLRWRDFVRVSVWGYALSIFTMVGLILWAGLIGAVLSIMMTQAISLVVALWVLHRDVVEQENLQYWRYKPNRESLREVGRFVGPLAMVAALPMASIVVIRSMIVGAFGVEANGLYQAVWGISVTYMGLVQVSLNSFGVPKIASQLEAVEEVQKIQNHEFRLGIFVVVPMVIALSSLRQWWIPILYSASFAAAGDILVWQFAGDIFAVMHQSLVINLVPFERFGFIVFDSLVNWGVWVLGVWLLLPLFGLAAVPLSYFLSNTLAVLVAFLFQRRVYKFRLTARNKSLAGKMALVGIAGLASTHLLQNVWMRLGAGGLAFVVMLLWVPTKQEYSDLLALAREHAGRIGFGGDGDLP